MADLSVEVGAALNLAAGRLERVQRAIEALAAPHTVPFNGSVGADASRCVLGGPAGGKTWHVRRLSFGPMLGDVDSGGGTIILYVDNVEVTRSTTVPNAATWGFGELTVFHPSTLAVVWLDPSGVLAIDGQAVEMPESAQETP